jgi:RNA polymerase sigma-70 factor (ECF subfamily)
VSSRTDVTELLKRAQAGDRDSLDSILPMVYDELRAVARRQLALERSDHTLQPTALVHEAYIRLLEQTQVDWQNRLHFFSIASQMMRRILVNYAVERNAKKRGDGATKVQLDDAASFGKPDETLDIVLLDQVLESLATLDERQARIVELRFFGGMTIEETAAVLEISPATVKREWQMAKAWLQVQMQG